MSIEADGALLGRAQASLDEALRICRDFYPGEILSPRADGVLREIFGAQ